MKIIACEPNTPEWHAARCGHLTASRIADVVRKGQGGKPSKMRATYVGELVAERLSGQQCEGFTSKEMQWGHEHEGAAASMYAFLHDADVQPVGGFVLHPTIEWAGASPDRLVGSNGLLEIKCPNSSTHIASLLGADIDPDYQYQMAWQLACTGREWCDHVSFDPRMPGDMQLDVRRYVPESGLIARLEAEARNFLSDVETTIQQLTLKYREAA